MTALRPDGENKVSRWKTTTPMGRYSVRAPRVNTAPPADRGNYGIGRWGPAGGLTSDIRSGRFVFYFLTLCFPLEGGGRERSGRKGFGRERLMEF